MNVSYLIALESSVGHEGRLSAVQAAERRRKFISDPVS
jgi:hypothetical protein